MDLIKEQWFLYFLVLVTLIKSYRENNESVGGGFL